MATPVGVISTFWKNLYLRSGVEMKGVEGFSSPCFDAVALVVGGESLMAAAVENALLLLDVDARGVEMARGPSTSSVKMPRDIKALATRPVPTVLNACWLNRQATA